MKTNLDIETLNWLLRLLIVGVLLIAIFTFIDGFPNMVRILGCAFITAGIMFLVDVEGSKKFRLLYWLTLISSILVAIQAASVFFARTEQDIEIFRNLFRVAYAISLMTVVVFSASMRELCVSLQLENEGKEWSRVGKVAAGFYVLPFLAFFGTGMGRLAGIDVDYFYGPNPQIPIPSYAIEYGIRVFFYIPPALVLWRLHRTREAFQPVAP